jgi:hypothetical protein
MKWMRYRHAGQTGFGHLVTGPEGEQLQPCSGELFGEHRSEGDPIPLEGLEWLPPCQPRVMLALWNNFHAAADKNGWARPAEPLYFVKTPNSLAAHRQAIAQPAAYDGRVAYEGELAIVIGRETRAVSVEAAPAHIFRKAGDRQIRPRDADGVIGGPALIEHRRQGFRPGARARQNIPPGPHPGAIRLPTAQRHRNAGPIRGHRKFMRAAKCLCHMGEKRRKGAARIACRRLKRTDGKAQGGCLRQGRRSKPGQRQRHQGTTIDHGDCRYYREQAAPPSTQNRAQWGWFKATGCAASARVAPSSKRAS